jgi:transketolase
MKTESQTGAGAVGHNEMANAIRALAMDAVQAANSGHPGAPMGMADIATVLFTRHLKFDPADPQWPDRDRFVLSNGHASMLLYALLYLTGYADMTIDEIKNFRQLGSRTPGHPEYGHAAGVETTTGPLGQGLANAVGMALAERMMAARFGDALVDHFTYVFAGDGCLMEGISHEAISLAGHLRLSKLIVLFDDNGISIDGGTDLTVSDDQIARFAASGWDVARADGHDPDAIDQAITAAKTTDRPSLIACRTVAPPVPMARRSVATRLPPHGMNSAGPTRRSRCPRRSSKAGAQRDGPAHRRARNGKRSWQRSTPAPANPSSRCCRAICRPIPPPPSTRTKASFPPTRRNGQRANRARKRSRC